MFSKYKLAEELKKKGWSRYKLSKESGIAQTTLRDIFGKKQVTPTLQTLEKIATALNIPVNNLLVEYPSPTVSNTDSEALLSNLINIERSNQLIKEISNNSNIQEEILNKLNVHEEIIKKETTLLENYNKLDTDDKNKVIDYTKLLGNQDKYKIATTTTNEISATKEDDEFTKAQKKALEARKKAEQYFKENPHLMPIASHDKEGNFTEEDYKHDDDIMKNDDLWK